MGEGIKVIMDNGCDLRRGVAVLWLYKYEMFETINSSL
jgi:hypothetical protein